jgi:Zn-dependent oligopeptidase
MAKTPETVDEFLAKLGQQITPAAEKVMDHQRELKKAEEGIADHLFLWDT